MTMASAAAATVDVTHTFKMGGIMPWSVANNNNIDLDVVFDALKKQHDIYPGDIIPDGTTIVFSVPVTSTPIEPEPEVLKIK